MADELKMPKLGETVTEGTISAWLKAVGDTVEFDELLVEVSTDKVESEIPSPYSGTVLQILVSEGETVEVGAVLARIGDPTETTTGGTLVDRDTSAASESVPPPDTGRTIVPTGRARVPASSAAGRVLSPVVRRLAADHGIDLAGILGSGSTGRIRREDVEVAIQQAETATTTASASTAPTPVAPTTLVAGERDQIRPLSRMRLTIADRMTQSLQISPHVWTSVEVDLEAIEEVRRTHKARFRDQEGMSLTYLTFIARAVCDALRAFPATNSSIDAECKQQTFHSDVHLGIAVDLDEQGLVAPVVRNADGLNLRGMARAIKTAATKASGGNFSADDLSGSTFTITNPGPFGDYASAPIINQPNVGILSTNMVSRKPAVVGDALAIRYMTILGFSYDHRAFDGVTASRFLAQIRDDLQSRDWAGELA